ncbi:MAG TPA: alpha/beta hydrolase [Rhizomicrobium sp.]|jgi:acetyl esterase|nr:alpha/beta hydrolase [Rhizomicrobium sp.]
MPLDPLVKAFLDKAAAIPRPKAWEMPPLMARQSFAAMMQLTGPKDVGVGKIDNFTIPGPGGGIRARAYAPVAAVGSQPTLIYFHGGGFVVGSLESHDGLCRLFAAEGGFKVIAVDYRLAPEHPWPAAVDDAWAAFLWIEANAAELGVDGGRIAIGGDSAGGMLTAIVTQLARGKTKPRIAYQMLLFPGTQMGAETSSLHEFAVGYFLERRTIEYFSSLYLPPGTDRNSPKVSPLRAKDFSGLPPAFVMLGGYDPLHDEGLAYAEKLKAAGVRVTIADYAEMVHCFIYLQTVLPEAHEAVAKAAKAVKAALDAA